MSGGCGYCGRSGHSIDICEKRLERVYGTSADPSAHTENYMRAFGIDEESEETATDGGVIDPTRTEQASISDFKTALELRREQNTDDETKDETPNWQPYSPEEPDTSARVPCKCGKTVTKQFALVLSPTEDRVENCPECSSFREIAGMHERIGSGVGKKDSGGGSI